MYLVTLQLTVSQLTMALRRSRSDSGTKTVKEGYRSGGTASVYKESLTMCMLRWRQMAGKDGRLVPVQLESKAGQRLLSIAA